MAETPRTVAQDCYVTHSAVCWQWHPACARQRLLDVERLLDRRVFDGQGAQMLIGRIRHLVGIEEESRHD